MRPSRRPSMVAAGALAATALLAGCSSGQSASSATDASSAASAGQSASSGASAASGTASSADVSLTDATPRPVPVCNGLSVPDVVRHAEPSVVTVRTSKGLGSGIVYRKHIVITDQHVVALQEGSPQVYSQVQLVLADGTTVTGRVIGSDLPTDLAVIKVDRDLPPLTFRTSVPPAGSTVLALGSPLGFSSSVTEGIVSAIGRNLPASQGSPPLVDLIQTDAPISPGNSGGALLDTCGHVVGVNEAYIPPQSGAVSLGFATPSVVATHIADQLIAHGHATHPYLGVQITDLTPRIVQALGTDAHSGVAVMQVVAGGPADKAGVRRGDVITKLGGSEVSDFADLLGALRKTEPGQKVDLTIDREGSTKTLSVTIGSRGSE